MSRQDADAYQQQGQQMNRLCRLQQDIPEDAKAQEDEEMQVTAGTYLVFVACHQAVYGTYCKHYKQIAQRSNLPQWEILQGDGLEGAQFDERLIKKLHFIVKIGMSQQEPVGQAPTYEASEKALRGECLETVCAYPENNVSCGKNRLPAPMNRNE